MHKMRCVSSTCQVRLARYKFTPVSLPYNICSSHTSGGCGLSKEMGLKTAMVASTHTQALHKKLNEAVQLLEEHVVEEKAIRLEMMRSDRYRDGSGSTSAPISVPVEEGSMIIGKDDPLLQWDSLHEARGAPEEST